MKKIALILVAINLITFFAFISFGCRQPLIEDRSHTEQDSIAVLASNLETYYKKKNAKEFFKIFPVTYEVFNDLYGFDDVKGKKILYDRYVEHIDFLFGNNEIDKSSKLIKTIDLCTCAKWEPDASSLLQKESRQLIGENLQEALFLMNKLPPSDATCLWNFLLDNDPIKDKKNIEYFNNLYNKALILDKIQADKIKSEFFLLESREE